MQDFLEAYEKSLHFKENKQVLPCSQLWKCENETSVLRQLWLDLTITKRATPKYREVFGATQEHLTSINIKENRENIKNYSILAKLKKN